MTYLFQLTQSKSAVLLACFGYAEEAVVPAALCGYPVCALAPYAFSDMRSLSLLREDFWGSGAVYVCSDEAAELIPGTFSETAPGLSDVPAHPMKNSGIFDPAAEIQTDAIRKKEEALPDLLASCRRRTALLVPVTAITDNSFSCGGSVSALPRLCGRAVSAVSLPASVRQIGRYAFYGCEKLHRIRMYSTTSDLGTGLFMGCDAVDEIDMTVTEEGRSCLQEVLLGFRKPLELIYRIQKRTDMPQTEDACPVKYHLIFPEFFENADENTPARITTRDLHGSGLFYRNCFANTQFQIARYDSLFPHAEANEPEGVTTALAFFRLACPESLDDTSRARYGHYLAAHTKALAALLSVRFQTGLLHVSDLEAMCSAPPLSAEAFFDCLLDETARLKVPALSAILMELRRRCLSAARAQPESNMYPEQGTPAEPRHRHFEL